MKSLPEQKEDLLSTTMVYKKLKIKKNRSLNRIDSHSVDHDMTASNTMIKITYKKALKDQNASEGTVDYADTVFDWNIKKKKPKQTAAEQNDISFIAKPAKGRVHLSLKKPPADAVKKKKYVNGLNLTVKPNNPVEENCVSKVQKIHHEGGGGSSPKKPRTVLNKQISKRNSDIRFLKGGRSVNPKAGIVQRSHGDAKKTKISKGSDKRIQNGVKNKAGVDKKMKNMGGLKQKASNTELNVFAKCKKPKISENKGKEVNGGGSVVVRRRSGGKKPLMLVDPDLPPGWSRFIRTKNKGLANEKHIVYVVNPQGRKFRFKWKLRKYLQSKNSTLNADQFFFGLYNRPKTSNSSSPFEKYEDDSADAKNSKGHESETSPEPENETGGKHDESSNNEEGSSDGKKLLLFDPDLPFGWKRVIHSNAGNGRKSVHIVSPDGKIFTRRYRLHQYLIKHQFNHDLDRFYFGLYPKKEGNCLENSGKETEKNTRSSEKCFNPKSTSNTPTGCALYEKAKTTPSNPHNAISLNAVKNDLDVKLSHSAMYDDPNLPDGWKRHIKIRTCGESAGRMEVIIVSPDGKRHRSKKLLEDYLLQKQLKYKVGDFDFTLFGKSNVKKAPATPPSREPDPESDDFSFLSMRKKFTGKPVPELDISSLKDTVITPEGHMINAVNGLMMCTGLSTARNERRQRLSRAEHEKQLKDYLSSEGDVPFDGCEIPTFWIQKLVKCKANFRSLESDAASTVVKLTKEFIKLLSLQALAVSEQPQAGLRYEDLANLVDRTEYLSFLKTLIPKKITFKEYVRLNRPKQFMSFT